MPTFQTLRHSSPRVLILLPLIGCLFATTIAEAVSFSEINFFLIGRVGVPQPGSISYAGGNAPLVGSDLVVTDIVTGLAPLPENLLCISCTLNFTTGPFNGVLPPSPFGTQPGHSFAGGGSIQIVGGAVADPFGGPPDPSSFFLPDGTTLLTGIPTGAFTFQDPLFGNLDNVFLTYEDGTLHPDLKSHFGLPANSSIEGFSLLGTTTGSNAPDPFSLSLSNTTSQGEPGFVRASAVPLPATMWPFAIGVVTLVAWRWPQSRVANHS